MTDMPIAALVECVDREAKFRSTTYPRWIKSGKLTVAAAEQERLRLAAVRRRLIESEAINRLLPQLKNQAWHLLEEAHEAVEAQLPKCPEWLA